tara:strand:- start:3012 stop:4193 length:1182 start_codon:yes stop_codon:yes gene_type:complete
MRKSNIVKPTSLKGSDKLDRIRQLMPKVPVNEGITRSVVELTKMGPDGNVYAIVRENHEYYIKISENKDSLLSEDFNYIGGLQNKKDKAYSSYAKAIKQLNLKFMSINEAIGKSGNFNVFESDDLVSEHHPLKADMKLSDKKGIGNGQEYVVDSKGAELKYDNKEGKEEDGFGDNVADSTCEKDIEKVKLSENETAIDSMITESFDSKEDLDKYVGHEEYQWYIIDINGKVVGGEEYLRDAFENLINMSTGVSPGELYLLDEYGDEVTVDEIIDDKLGSFGYGEPGDNLDDYDQDELDGIVGEILEKVHLKAKYEDIDGEPVGDSFTKGFSIEKKNEDDMYEAKKGFSIARAIKEMDNVIDSIATEDDKVDDILESLGESERAIMMEALKKKD